jgi:hypothetical protein
LFKSSFQSASEDEENNQNEVAHKKSIYNIEIDRFYDFGVDPVKEGVESVIFSDNLGNINVFRYSNGFV